MRGYMKLILFIGTGLLLYGIWFVQGLFLGLGLGLLIAGSIGLHKNYRIKVLEDTIYRRKI